jgi:hypothetical protein
VNRTTPVTASAAYSAAAGGRLRDHTCTGTPVYSETVTVSGNGVHKTQHVVPYQRRREDRLLVRYSGDANNEPTTSACADEQVVIDFK